MGVCDDDEFEPGDYVMLAVRDTGHGMTPEVLEHAFEPFYTTKDVGEGSGLGLSLVYGFSKQSGGHARITSEEGRGTAVHIYLPRVTGPVSVADTRPSQSQARGNGKMVLVVEDDEKVRGLAVNAITSLGYRVCEAEDGESALETIEETVGIDIMLTDVALPGAMSGRDLAAVVARRRLAIKIVYSSACSDSVTRPDDDADLLSKPYRREALAHALRRAVDAEAG